MQHVRDDQQSTTESQRFQSQILSRLDKIEKKIEEAHVSAIFANRNANEALFALRLENATKTSSWFKCNDFSGYHAAADFAMLFGLYRVLERFRPKSILELGAGESTRMIAQYTNTFADSTCLTIDHNPYWIELIKENFPLAKDRHTCKTAELVAQTFENQPIKVYKNLDEIAKAHAESYDLIIVDGGDSSDNFSRLSVLRCLDLLAPTFTILIDDLDRNGEGHLLQLMNLYFNSRNIQISCKFIQENGLNKQMIISSADQKSTWV
jgi:predicted O-methyltransferase YrrM